MGGSSGWSWDPCPNICALMSSAHPTPTPPHQWVDSGLPPPPHPDATDPQAACAPSSSSSGSSSLLPCPAHSGSSGGWGHSRPQGQQRAKPQGESHTEPSPGATLTPRLCTCRLQPSCLSLPSCQPPASTQEKWETARELEVGGGGKDLRRWWWQQVEDNPCRSDLGEDQISGSDCKASVN